MGSSLFWHVTQCRLRKIPGERISHLHGGMSEITTDDGFRRIRMLTFVHTGFSGISFAVKHYQNYRTLEGHLDKKHALIKQNISDLFSDFLFLSIPLAMSDYS